MSDQLNKRSKEQTDFRGPIVQNTLKKYKV